jgi:molybdate/tungstate transport system ATP-binding protein
MLELISITKKLGSFVLPELSLTIETGQYLTLVGPCGVGKSVLLEIIAGFIPPTAGQILLNGKDITQDPPEKRGIALLYQDHSLFPHMTVKKNIAYGLKLKGLKPAQVENQISAIVDLIGITHLLSRKPANLSGGESQLAALARALVIEPQLVLLDEPLSSLDLNTRVRLRKILKRINAELNTTVLHVTHDPDEAMQLGDQICVMLDSRIRQVGPGEELFRRPSDPAVADFLGMKNILSVEKSAEDIYSVFDQKIHLSCGQPISHIWIKPEDIILSTQPFDSSARNQFECKVLEIEMSNPFISVLIQAGKMKLTSLITYTSLENLKIKAGTKIYATFKTSALHSF